MRYEIFPENNEKEIAQKANDQIKIIRNDFDDKMKRTKQRADSKKYSLSIGDYFLALFESFKPAIICAIIALVVDIIAFRNDTPILEVSTLVIVFIGVFVYYITEPIRSSAKIDKAKQEYKDAEGNIDLDIKTIRDDATYRIKSYKDSFEKAMDEEASYFLESKALPKIIDWMMPEFMNVISNAGNNKNDKIIEMSFLFSVTENDINIDNFDSSKSIKLFDYAENGLGSLDLIRVAGLARALQTSLQMRISMEYSEKMGVMPKIQISEDRSEKPTNVSVKMNLQADNKNYVAKSSGW